MTDSYVLEVLDVVRETADASSIVFGVPDDLKETFAFTPGQFLTLAVPSDQTGLAARCYSISTTPHSGKLQVTVKRTVDGYASNWINDNLHPGDTMRVLPPSGIFTPADINADFLLFAAGSGVTPILSIARTALERGAGRIVMLYANRDESSVIFAEQFRELCAEYADRFQIIHWLETVQGLPSEAQVRAFASQYLDYTAFVCGPGPFMKLVTDVLKGLEFPRPRRHQEKFVSLGGNPFGDVEEIAAAQQTLAEADDASDEPPAPTFGPVAVEVELDGQSYSFDDWSGSEPLLEFFESKGIEAPFSCREGQCSACACMILEGDVVLKHNEVLDADDLADGIRLACQALPASEKLRVTYNG